MQVFEIMITNRENESKLYHVNEDIAEKQVKNQYKWVRVYVGRNQNVGDNLIVQNGFKIFYQYIRRGIKAHCVINPSKFFIAGVSPI